MCGVFSAGGNLENDLSDVEAAAFFRKLNSAIQLENKPPLNNCYQRTSDAPVMEPSAAPSYTVKSARRRRAIQLDDREAAHMLKFTENQLNRHKRSTVTYDYNAFCDRVFTSDTSSTLAR